MTTAATTLETITLTPGCLGRDVHLLDAKDPTYNRPVERSTVNEYKRAMDDIERVGNLISLWRSPGGTLKILDGQHRITAVNEGDKPRQFLAVVYPSDAPVQAMAEALHKQRGHNIQQSLYITQGRSAWPGAIEGEGQPFLLVHKRSHRRRVIPVRWKSFMSAVSGVEDCLVRRRLAPSDHATRDGILAAWLADLESLTTTPSFWQTFLVWWCEGLLRVESRQRRTFLSPRILHAAALLRWCNQHADDAVIDRARDRVLNAHVDGLAELRQHMTSGSRRAAERFIHQFLFLANHRARTNRLAIFGHDGRQEA